MSRGTDTAPGDGAKPDGAKSGDEVFQLLQRKARSDGTRTGKPAPTAEYLTRHALESFLDRLSRTEHAGDYVLKGGILLAVYGVRRPTRDVDAEAISSSVTAANIEQVVRDVAAVEVDDGVAFDISTISVQEIRETAEYPGLRVRVKASIGTQVITVAWDISTGDPIIPVPQPVKIPRVLGEPIEMRIRCRTTQEGPVQGYWTGPSVGEPPDFCGHP